MKRIYLLGAGIGSAALLAAGTAAAAPPPGHFFNNWAAHQGRVILHPNVDDLNQVTNIADFENVGSDCTPPACVVLLNEIGMLQARVRANGDPEEMGYYQTINVQNGFSGLPSAADFRNESFVEASNGGFPMAALNYVELDDGDYMQAKLATGSLQVNEPMMEIYQVHTITGHSNIDFYFEQQGQNPTAWSTNPNGGALLRIDHHESAAAGDRFTPVTIRAASGFYTQDTSDNVLEVIGSAPITFEAGDHVGTVFMAGRLWHLGFHHTANSDDNRRFQVHNVSNFTSGESASWVSVNNTIDDTGLGVVNFQAAWTDDYWNSNVFGDAPQGADTNIPTFPGAPDHPDLLYIFQ